MKEGTAYIIIQSAAGVLAGLSTILLDGIRDSSAGNVVGPREPSFAVGAPLVEFVYTFMLAFVVLNVAVAAQKGNNFYGVAIGFVVLAGGYGGGYVSGGAFNPAVTLGVNFMGFNPANPYLNAFYVPVYIAVQLAGGLVAPVALHIVRPETIPTDKKHINAVTEFFHKVEAMFDPDDTSEFIGAFFIALGITLNGIAGLDNRNSGGNPGAALSVGATIICMIFALGDISGGLFNPAVTIAYLGRFHGTGCGVGKEKIQDFNTSKKEGVKYFICQVLGALAGMGVTILIWLASGDFPIAPIGPQPTGTNATSVGHESYHTIGQAFFAETFGTFLFCYVAICVGTTFHPLKEFKAIAVGCAYVAGGYAFGPLSGGILNPAITIAACVVNLSAVTNPRVPLIFVFGELLGGILAVVVFKFLTHPHEYEMDGQPEGYERTDGRPGSQPLLA